MISRLVLVGVVGALGISVPTWPEVQEWMGAAHSWTAYQLAVWDASARSEADSITMVPTSRPMPTGTGPDGGLVARPSDRPSPPFEPIVVDERESGLAYELNRHAEGLDIASGAPIAEQRPSAGTRKDSNDARRQDDLSPRLVAETLELRLLVDLFQAAETADRHALPTAATIAARRGRAPIAPLACVFTRSATAQQPATTDRTTGSESGPGGTTPASVGMRTLSDVMPGTGPELDCFAPPFDQPALAVAVATGSRPAFDPIDPGTDPGVGLADKLNRTSEGLAVDLPAPVLNDRDRPQPSSRPGPIAPPAAPVGAVLRPIPAPHVAQALRLTGEAVHAWMNVLTGPAIVQVSAR